MTQDWTRPDFDPLDPGPLTDRERVSLDRPDHDNIEAWIALKMYGDHTDPKIKELYCRIGPRGASWNIKLDRVSGGRRIIKRVKIGTWPEMSRLDAQRVAQIEIGKILSGAAAPGKNSALKVAMAADEYLAKLKRNADRAGKPARWHYNAFQLYETLIKPKWSTWSLYDLVNAPSQVRDWHFGKSKNNGPVSANKAARLLRSIYAYAAKANAALPARDPCSMVEFNPETPAQGSMPFGDFPAWLDAWNKIPAMLGHNRPVRHFAPTKKQFHLFALFSGMRPGEISRIRWSDVKPAQRVIEIKNPKMTKTIRVIMSAPIARILIQCRDITRPKSGDSFVFPHCGQIAGRCGLPYSGHDLRHTWATVAAAVGIDGAQADVMGGWSPTDSVRGGYVTALVLAATPELRKAQRKISARIIKHLGSDPTDFPAPAYGNYHADMMEANGGDEYVEASADAAANVAKLMSERRAG
jgi:integrase